ncbi:MAG: DUF1778 domain-containing protein [Solirubrobacterales bacterium]|nr:DUF1778 domain-containing protein [Solirubrobacterales bacterium]
MAARASRIEIRVSDEERAMLQAAADAQGEKLIEFVRRAARADAEQVMAERASIAVESERAEAFLAALVQPAAEAERGLRRLTALPGVPSRW